MVDTHSIDVAIKASGLKVDYIVKQLGISRQAFDLKKKNERKFRAAEVYVLCDLLKISDADKQSIFFINNVE